MKIIAVSVSVLLLLLSNQAVATESLFDMDGDAVMPGNKYYIVSAIWGAGGGGLDLAHGRNGYCPLDVIQHGTSLMRGTSVTFYTQDNSTGYAVQTSSDVNIKFNAEPDTCEDKLPVWKVDDYDRKTRKYFITTGGVLGNPGCETVGNWFRFESVGYEGSNGVYKMAHCPSVCDSRYSKLCKEIGIHFYRGQRRLVLTDHAFPPIVFFKDSDDVKFRAKLNPVI